MWRKMYETLLKEHSAAPVGDVSAAEKLLQTVLDKDDVVVDNVDATKLALGAIGRELMRPMSEVKAIGLETPRHEKLSVLQLQVVSRLLLCCHIGVFSALGPSSSSNDTRKTTKKKIKKKASKSKRDDKQQDVRSELRELLDRVALLIDSANPPSIAESEDEPSPFHYFLLRVLEKQLGCYIPQVFTFLRDEYELADDPEPLTMRTLFAQKTSTTPVKPAQAIGPTCILSALKDERPAKKRPLSATSDSFKEVRLPSQLSKSARLPTPHRNSKTSDGNSYSASTQQSTHSRKMVPAPTATTLSSSRSTKRSLSAFTDASLVSLAAASKKHKPSRAQGTLLPKPMPLPLLVRNVDRQLFPGRSSTSTPSSSSSRPLNNATSRPGASTVPSRQAAPSARLGEPAVTNLTRASIVMRTPDRPQRVQRSQPRILIASSPPLRNPFASARLRKPGPQLPK